MLKNKTTKLKEKNAQFDWASKFNFVKFWGGILVLAAGFMGYVIDQINAGNMNVKYGVGVLLTSIVIEMIRSSKK